MGRSFPGWPGIEGLCGLIVGVNSRSCGVFFFFNLQVRDWPLVLGMDVIAFRIQLTFKAFREA